ncbi:ABCG31 [Scenedesmus sp. PABB004]|nr:ABCG31 [Scenedesmus sp. PABB004]
MSTQLVLHVRAAPSSPSASSSSDSTGADGSKAKRGLLVTFEDVGYSLPARGGQRTTILVGITGCFCPGAMTAVVRGRRRAECAAAAWRARRRPHSLTRRAAPRRPPPPRPKLGPSGSGKTTLLDVLAGRKTAGAAVGAVRYGGLPPSRALLRRAAGYVEQFDTLLDSLTCEEMLSYTAALKRPRREPLATKQAAVRGLLRRLGLAGVAGAQIGGVLKRGISGGQAKRLNIGIALITEPSVLFLDEPTSGLDSFTAAEVMGVVAGLARADGTTVASTIHSPSSSVFGLFDRLLVLLGGRLVYLGPPGEAAIAYFTASVGAREPRLGDNLAEWMLEAVTQAQRGGGGDGAGSFGGKAGSGGGGDLAAAYRRSELAQANLSELAALAESQARRRAHSASMRELQALAGDDGGGGGGGARGAGGAAGRRGCSGGGSGDGGARCSCGGGGPGGEPCCSCSAACLDCGAYVTPPWWGLKVLLQYRTLRHYRSPAYVLPRLLEKLLFAAVTLSLYWGKGDDLGTLNVPVLSSLLFLQVLAPICAAMMYLPSIGLERPLYIRERSDGLYRPVTYLVFKLLDELLLMAPVTAGTSAAVFFGARLRGSWALFWLAQYATLANGTALAYFLASVSPGLMVAMPLLSFVLILALMTCGFMIRTAAMPLFWSWVVKGNVVHYSWAALMVNQYGGQPGAGRLGGVGVLQYFGFAPDSAWTSVHAVAGFFAGWSLLAWLALAFLCRGRR